MYTAGPFAVSGRLRTGGGIRGSDLVSKFLETDNSAYHIKTTDYGKSIRQKIDPKATYYVVTGSYTADYAYNRHL